ncbi:hypothetical protein RVV73_000232 [Citrobacter freundii]|uniref:hypothetical protein n=1 Tax=Enterobacteriaceae TaxID=543 RepID=UPI000DB3CC35|nr:MULTISPECIES: hypothetical protein [Enterobacteriaceae]ELK6342539.1 hypothetical protein [Citrobacter freundii]MEB6427763.1 hypothetical protein [Citrobacter freundii]PZR23489.1 MAG: hypothetical protein DI535_24020 [Citrobacter freundii]HCJ7420373.1 hypothetical protein [Citrobacter freundii]HCJ7776812.1 hypothetical protein [Citrobacter freundii]
MDEHGDTPGNHYWHRFMSLYYVEHPSTLGKYAYSRFSSLEPLEQVYIGELKNAFEIWFDVLHAKPPSEPTTFQKMFLDEPMSSLMIIDETLVYDIFFRFIYERDIKREEISDRLDALLVDDKIPYPCLFEVSCYFYIIATRIFADENFDNKEIQFFRAMFEAINSLKEFTSKHDAYLQEKNKELHKKISGKGGENKWSKIRAEVIRLLKEEISSGQCLGRFNSNADLTEYLLPMVEKYISICDIKSPDDLFYTLESWSTSPKSDISALYGLLVI